MQPSPDAGAVKHPIDGERARIVGRRMSWRRVCVIAVGIGSVAVVGFVGSPIWCAVRGALAAGVGAVAFGATSIGSSRSSARSSARSNIVSTILGVIALPVGAVFALRYLGDDPVPRGVGGAVAALGSLPLLVGGTRSLLGGISRWRRLMAVPAFALIVAVVWYPIAIALFAVNVPRPALGSQRPSDRGLTFEDITFHTDDGVVLSGWYIPGTNHAAVVVLHGASSTRSATMDHAVVLARHGYGVLLFDARGHGLSDGRAMEFGWNGDLDIAGALDYLSTRTDVDPLRIGAVGLSMGGEQAIGALPADMRLRSVVSEGATGRVAGDKAWLSNVYGLRGGVTRAVDTVMYRLTDMLTETEAPSTLRDAAADAAPRQILLITAGDVADEGHAAAFIERGSPGNVEIWTVPGAGHTGGLHTDPRAWEATVMAFLDDTLLAR